jgi:hypothetical protein
MSHVETGAPLRLDLVLLPLCVALVHRVWPGANSNTFVVIGTRAVPGLHVDLSPTAIGKD